MARVLEIETAVACHEMPLDVARLGSSANGVCPDQVDTDAPAGKCGKEKQAAVQRTPMWLFGQPEEIATALSGLRRGRLHHRLRAPN